MKKEIQLIVSISLGTILGYIVISSYENFRIQKLIKATVIQMTNEYREISVRKKTEREHAKRVKNTHEAIEARRELERYFMSLNCMKNEGTNQCVCNDPETSTKVTMTINQCNNLDGLKQKATN